MTVLALDIGATKLAAGRVASDGDVHDIRTVAVPATSVWDACRQLLLEVAADDEVQRLGIGSAGPVDTTAGATAPFNIPEWRTGFPIVAAAQELFPSATIRFAMDGVCLALAEHRFGAARGIPDVLAITVSSGVGGGFLLGGSVALGRTGNAGHVGHVLVPGFDDSCACGGHGCVEAVASGHSAVLWARAQGWVGDTGIELAEAARTGDPIAIVALHRAGTALGQAISSAVATLDVGLVVVGGGFAQSGPPLWNPLRESVARHSRLRFQSGLQVVHSQLGVLATLIGASALTVAS
ncbi:ROK family protein [Nocardia gipuzkoensis]|uniref:ROK family protein n=1 Tax=Nocardia gipuzkoensis TaxID=2749991 RepID=UPI00237E1B5B|nr:ROK family protein [Nocardia gipuzkoensis]MDE1675317.1 ROK family protein [Nocardia gipuzkoensis]